MATRKEYRDYIYGHNNKLTPPKEMKITYQNKFGK